MAAFGDSFSASKPPASGPFAASQRPPPAESPFARKLVLFGGPSVSEAQLKADVEANEAAYRASNPDGKPLFGGSFPSLNLPTTVPDDFDAEAAVALADAYHAEQKSKKLATLDKIVDDEVRLILIAIKTAALQGKYEIDYTVDLARSSMPDDYHYINSAIKSKISAKKIRMSSSFQSRTEVMSKTAYKLNWKPHEASSAEFTFGSSLKPGAPLPASSSSGGF